VEVSLGQLIRWNGRLLRVCGFEPMSIPDRRIELEDVRSGELIRVPLVELAPPAQQSAAA
jgi:hypothetical protein